MHLVDISVGEAPDASRAAPFAPAYEHRGFILHERLFDEPEVQAMRAEVSALAGRDVPGRVFEKDGLTVRALHGCHLHSPLFARLVRLPKLLSLACELLHGGVYVYQFKINFKARFSGDMWQWHQDYIYWHHEDGMAAPDVVNVAIFLDDVTEFNGPMMLIPGSHRRGLINVEERGATADGWSNTVSADLKYQLAPSLLEQLVADGGLEAAKGAAGSVLVFHPNLAHASPPNLSPYDRRLAIITYNRTTNAPLTLRRPEWLVGRDSSALAAVEGDAL